MWIADRCPYCLGGGLWLRTNLGGTVNGVPVLGAAVTAECANGCTTDEVMGALETYVVLEERTLDPADRGRTAHPGSWWARPPQGDDGG